MGWIAALGAALYGPFLYFEGELLPTTWAVLFDAVLLLTLLWGQRRGGVLAALVAGLVLGLGTLAVPNVLLFAPVAAWWVYRWWPAAAPRRRALHLAVFAVGLMMLVGPVTLRNRIVGSEWVLISFNAGVNFYLGNNPDYDRTVAARPGAGWSEVVDLPQREAGITQPGAGSNYLLGKAWEYIRTEPGDYLALLLHKGYLFWHGAEIPRNTDPYFAAEYSPLLRLFAVEIRSRIPVWLGLCPRPTRGGLCPAQTGTPDPRDLSRLALCGSLHAVGSVVFRHGPLSLASRALPLAAGRLWRLHLD